MANKKAAFLVVTALLVGSILCPHVAIAEDQLPFNPSFILSDEELGEYQSLTLSEINYFLIQKGSGLSYQFFPNHAGVLKTAAEIIFDAAREYRINPKVILTTLQKEQSLVSNPFPSAHQLDRAMGYGCPDGGSCGQRFLGLGKQVDGAAWQFRQYLTYPQKWNFQKDRTYTIDGVSVTPATTATAGLYNYTPHYSGNAQFWRLWTSYWTKVYPDGSLVKTGDSATVWLIEYGTRRAFGSYAAFVSRYDPKKILAISRADLEKYQEGPMIKFANFSLLRSPDGAVYLLVNNSLRYITSPEAFRAIGFNWEEIIEVSLQDVSSYVRGPDITTQSKQPIGTLLGDKQTGEVFYIENGYKYPIPSPEVLYAHFRSQVVNSTSTDSLAGYIQGPSMLFPDGELVQAAGSSEVYVIASGQRRWIKDEAAFAAFGYSWDNIIITRLEVLLLHPLGEPLVAKNKLAQDI